MKIINSHRNQLENTITHVESVLELQSDQLSPFDIDQLKATKIHLETAIDALRKASVTSRGIEA